MTSRLRTCPTAASGTCTPRQPRPSSVCASCSTPRASAQHCHVAARHLARWAPWSRRSNASRRQCCQYFLLAGGEALCVSRCQEHHDPFVAREKGRAPGLVPLLQDPAVTSPGQMGPALAKAQASPQPHLLHAAALTPAAAFHLALGLEGTGLRYAVLSWCCRGPALGPAGASRLLQPELDVGRGGGGGVPCHPEWGIESEQVETFVQEGKPPQSAPGS